LEQLEWVYANADLILLPSEYEGLGLPILEAVTYFKKIVCSDIPVFREISEDAFYYCNPLDPIDIANKLGAAAEELTLSMAYREKYGEIAQKYTWIRTAEVATGVIHSTQSPKGKRSKPRMAILAPSPDGYSAIGKVVAEAHASLSEHFEIVYYFEKGPWHAYLRPDFLSRIAENHPVQDFNAAAYRTFDAVLYHIGNSEYHLATIANALVYPGICIFHDTYLEGAYSLLSSLGFIKDARLFLEEELDKTSGTKRGKYLGSIVANQKAIITHSSYAQKAVTETAIYPTVTQLNLPVAVPKLNRCHKNPNAPIEVGLAGIIADVKGFDLIEELACSENSGEIAIKVFGYLLGETVDERIKKLTNVAVITNPTDHEFQSLLGRLDVLLNYRAHYRGETSLTVLEAMRYGVTVIVRDIGWYSELPDDVIVKVATKEAAIAAVFELTQDRARLARISAAARKYVIDNHSHADYAAGIAGAVTNSLKSESSITANAISQMIIDNKPSKKELIAFIRSRL
jgi:glycosyltransferase involved in cell wall biosynthesis